MVSTLECTRVHFVQVSVSISRPDGQGLGLGLETWRPRSQSWSQDSMLGANACNTITVICSTFKGVLCHQLELMQPVLWFRDHGLETRVHFVQVSVSVSRPTKRSWKQHWVFDVGHWETTQHMCVCVCVCVWCSRWWWCYSVSDTHSTRSRRPGNCGTCVNTASNNELSTSVSPPLPHLHPAHPHPLWLLILVTALPASKINMYHWVDWLVGRLGFNGTFSTNRLHRAIKNIEVCWRCLSLIGAGS